MIVSLDFVQVPSILFCFVLIQEFVNNAQVFGHQLGLLVQVTLALFCRVEFPWFNLPQTLWKFQSYDGPKEGNKNDRLTAEAKSMALIICFSDL